MFKRASCKGLTIVNVVACSIAHQPLPFSLTVTSHLKLDQQRVHTVRVVCAVLLFEDGYDLAALAALPQAMMCRVENEVNELLGVAVAALSVLRHRTAIADASLSAKVTGAQVCTEPFTAHEEKIFRVSKPWKLAGWGWGFLVHLGNRLAGLEGAVSMTQNLTVAIGGYPYRGPRF